MQHRVYRYSKLVFKMPLQAFPAEILLQISSYLNYKDLRQFLNIIDPSGTLLLSEPQLREVLSRTELYDPDVFFLEATAPCYDCLQVLGRLDFAPIDRCLSDFMVGGKRFEERLCRECDKRHNESFHNAVEEENHFLRANFIRARICASGE